jgi:hypothetical protein
VTRLERFGPWVLGLAFAAPVLAARYPPMTDLPLHEGIVGILRHFGDPSMFPPGLYRYNLGEPNQLFHMVAWGLSYLVGTSMACKLVVAATMVAIPVSAAFFASHVGASRLGALFIAPIGLGWLFTWGLIANLIGIAALFVAIPALDRLAAEPGWRRALLSMGGVVLLYFAHEAMMILYGALALLFAAIYPLRPRATLQRLVPFVTALAVAVAQAEYQKRFMNPTLLSIPTMYDPVTAKLMLVPDIIFHSTDSIVRMILVLLSAVTLSSFFYLRSREREAPVPRRLRPFLLRYRFEVFAAACFAAYLAFPFTLNGATLVYHRFFPPAYTVLGVVAAPRNLAISSARIPRIFALVLPVATLLSSWPSFIDSDHAHRALERLFPFVAKRSAVAVLEVGIGDPPRDFNVGPSPARVIAERGGRLLYGFTESSIAAVVVARDYQWNEVVGRVSSYSLGFRPEHDFRMFRYAIVRSREPRVAALLLRALEPYASLVAQSGDFMLFESKYEVLPLLSPELPMPSPKPHTLRALLKAAEAEQEPEAEPSGGSAETPPKPVHL